MQLAVRPPLRVLAAVAAPTDLPTLDVGRERAQLQHAVEHLIEKGVVRDRVARERHLARRAERHAPRARGTCFHYVGHGGLDPDTGTGVLALCDADSTIAFWLAAADLGPAAVGPSVDAPGGAELVRGRAHRQRRPVLECRRRADPPRRGRGGRDAVPDHRSRRAGVLADVLRGAGRKRVGGPRWTGPSATPGGPSGLPCRAAASGARRCCTCTPKTASCSTWTLVAGRLSAAAGRSDAVGRAGAGRPDRATARTDRRPTGSAPRARAARAQGPDLLGGGRAQSLTVPAPRRSSSAWTASRAPWTTRSPASSASRSAPPASLPAGKTVADVFGEEGGSLLILGEPGSGKTTSMLGLLRQLLATVETDPTAPIPVVFNLSSWKQGQALGDWLVGELSAKYQIPKAIGQVWLQRQRAAAAASTASTKCRTRRAPPVSPPSTSSPAAACASARWSAAASRSTWRCPTA